MKKLEMKWASVAALAASTLFAAPTALAEIAVKTQISTELKNSHNGNHGRNETALRECGSSGYRTSTCYFDVHFDVADARVHDRKSKGSCDEGDEWGLRGNTMWIRDGCRAIFELSSVRFPEKRDRNLGNGRYETGRDDRDWQGHGDNRRDPAFRHVSYDDKITAIGNCAREANQQVYRSNAYSVQYINEPQVEVGRHGQLRVIGTMRIHGPRGFNTRDAECSIRSDGRISDFTFRR